jgi:hypothetical protein
MLSFEKNQKIKKIMLINNGYYYHLNINVMSYAKPKI